jgi:hypothetical protein
MDTEGRSAVEKRRIEVTGDTFWSFFERYASRFPGGRDLCETLVRVARAKNLDSPSELVIRAVKYVAHRGLFSENE